MGERVENPYIGEGVGLERDRVRTLNGFSDYRCTAACNYPSALLLANKKKRRLPGSLNGHDTLRYVDGW